MPKIGEVEYGEEAFAHMRRLYELVEAAKTPERRTALLKEAETIHELHAQFPGLEWSDVEAEVEPEPPAPVEKAPSYDQLELVAHARGSDPWTSHAAARSLGPEKLRDKQKAVHAHLLEHGPQHDELIRQTYAGEPQSLSGLRTRRKELQRAGFVRDTGRTVRLPSGRQSKVWEAIAPT